MTNAPSCISSPSNTYGGRARGSPALGFEVVAAQGRARSARLRLPHASPRGARTPLFMPVGTHGAMKGLTQGQLEALDCRVILANTYHMESAPGSSTVAALGGLHKFTGWGGGFLTDSGGFQMVSLLHLAEIGEEGVVFQNPGTGEQMLLTPEDSIRVQNRLGADIIMALDDVVSSVTADRARFEEATHRTTRWIDRCIEAHERPDQQNLFAIVQGGLDPELRRVSLDGLMARDAHLPGYAIGGLAGGEDKDQFWRVVAQCTAALPENKPRYVMGVGHPLDIVVCTALGADMFDSVFPTRTARFGTALVPEGMLRLKQRECREDHRPIDPGCDCMVCRTYTRAQLHQHANRGPQGAILISYHNLHYMQALGRRMRAAIEGGSFPDFVRDFLGAQFPGASGPPAWVRNAMETAGIPLD